MDRPPAVNTRALLGLFRWSRTGLPGLLLVAFLLPWLLVSCGGKPVGTQNGAQMIVGDMSLDPGLATRGPDETRKREALDPEWLLAVYAAGLLALLVGAVLAQLQRAEASRVLQNLATATMLAILVYFLHQGFRLERKLADKVQQNEAATEASGATGLGKALRKATRGAVTIEKQVGFHASFVLLALLGLLGIAERVLVPGAAARDPPA